MNAPVTQEPSKHFLNKVPIHVRLLGTAAGGGLPQWNCSCDNCKAARKGKIPARTQSSVAVSADGEFWFLVNASPDLHRQIENTPALQAHGQTRRNSPIAGVLLTNADLDHVLGLLLLREGEVLPIMATQAVQDTLTGSLGIDSLLGSYCGVQWLDAPAIRSPLFLHDGSPIGLSVRTIPLPGDPPRYAKHLKTTAGHSVAFLISDDFGATLLVAPDVAEINPELERALEESDAVLFDGTFWSENELNNVNGNARSSRDMGHLPIRDGGLQALENIPSRRKIFIHINNTNPILAAESPERAAVMTAGIIIGEDNMEFTL